MDEPIFKFDILSSVDKKYYITNALTLVVSCYSAAQNCNKEEVAWPAFWGGTRSMMTRASFVNINCFWKNAPSFIIVLHKNLSLLSQLISVIPKCRGSYLVGGINLLPFVDKYLIVHAGLLDIRQIKRKCHLNYLQKG